VTEGLRSIEVTTWQSQIVSMPGNPEREPKMNELGRQVGILWD